MDLEIHILNLQRQCVFSWARVVLPSIRIGFADLDPIQRDQLQRIYGLAESHASVASLGAVPVREPDSVPTASTRLECRLEFYTRDITREVLLREFCASPSGGALEQDDCIIQGFISGVGGMRLAVEIVGKIEYLDQTPPVRRDERKRQRFREEAPDSAQAPPGNSTEDRRAGRRGSRDREGSSSGSAAADG